MLGTQNKNLADQRAAHQLSHLPASQIIFHFQILSIQLRICNAGLLISKVSTKCLLKHLVSQAARGLCAGGRKDGCFPVQFLTGCYPPLQNLYESIKNEPFKIPEDDGNDLTHTFFNPDREGWLLKLGE